MARESKAKRDAKRFGTPERLADIIIQRGVSPLFDVRKHPFAAEQFVRWEKAIRSLVENAVVVDATNVERYVCEIYQNKFVDYESAIPNYMPPFQSMFVEFINKFGDRHGYLIAAFDGPGLKACPMPIPDSLSPDRTHTVIAESFALIAGAHGNAIPVGSTAIGIDDAGRIVGSIHTQVLFGALLDDAGNQSLQNFMHTATLPVFLAISFMHCKNVSVCPVEPNPITARERQKAGLKPFIRYHTINIDPMKQTLKTEGNMEANGPKKALHICRGHFSSYSEDKPLFGRKGMHGRFWMPAHVRGQINKGIVKSDYRVDPPSEPTQ